VYVTKGIPSLASLLYVEVRLVNLVGLVARIEHYQAGSLITLTSAYVCKDKTVALQCIATSPETFMTATVKDSTLQRNFYK
jgi:hypothetical protein